MRMSLKKAAQKLKINLTFTIHSDQSYSLSNTEFHVTKKTHNHHLYKKSLKNKHFEFYMICLHSFYPLP